MANVQYRGTGRRKSSVARVILTPGTGNFVINGKEAREYLASDVLNMIVNQPLELTNTKDKFDVTVNVYGGGTQDKLVQSVMVLLELYYKLVTITDQH